MLFFKAFENIFHFGKLFYDFWLRKSAVFRVEVDTSDAIFLQGRLLSFAYQPFHN